MDCQPCNSNNSNIVTLQSFNTTYSSGCCGEDCGCNGLTYDSKCVFYTGPNLPCSQINTNQSIEDALIKIDQKLCTTIGNYAIYNKACLNNSSAINTEQEFVEAISSYVCTLRADYDAYINNTFVAYQQGVTQRFNDITNPEITCAAAGITSADDLDDVYTKYCLAFADIYDKIDVASVSWDSCYTVEPNPTSITEGFNTLISQICELRDDVGAGGALPTFNNVGSCLPAPLTTTDGLVSTVNKIKTRLCTTPTFDINALTWGCTSKPSTTATDLQAAFGAVLAKITTLTQNLPAFSSDFVVTQTNGSDPCAGKSVALAATSILDKFVAVDNSDGSPGTLVQKLQAGSGVTFDVATTPGKLIINSSGGSATDQLVKLNVSDPTAGYLATKVQGDVGSSEGVAIEVVENNTDHKLTVSANVNFQTLWDNLLAFLDANPTTKAAFCQRVTSCLPDCIIPPNVTVIYNNTNSTTTTTTTTEA